MFISHDTQPNKPRMHEKIFLERFYIREELTYAFSDIYAFYIESYFNTKVY